jgi:hypothetical protein
VDYTGDKLIDEYSQHVEASNLNDVMMKVATYEHQMTKKFCSFCKKEVAH